MENQSKPTRYIIQDKHFALDDKFVITDDEGVVHYTVDSTLFSIGDKLMLYDNSGNELIKIRQEKFHLHQLYHIYSIRHDVDEMKLATIKRTGTLWHHKLEIDAVNGEYVMDKKGGLLSHEFILTKDGEIVAVVSRDTAPVTTAFWVDIASDREEYRAFLVAMVIVLSCAQRLPGNPLGTQHAEYIKV